MKKLVVFFSILLSFAVLAFAYESNKQKTLSLANYPSATPFFEEEQSENKIEPNRGRIKGSAK